MKTEEPGLSATTVLTYLAEKKHVMKSPCQVSHGAIELIIDVNSGLSSCFESSVVKRDVARLRIAAN